MKRSNEVHLWTSTAMLVLLLSACSTVQQRSQRAHYGAHLTVQAAELNEDERAKIDQMCPAGMPVPLAGIDPGPTEYAVHLGYALQYSNDLKIPLWVCEHLTSATVSGHLTGRVGFKADPQIMGPHSVNADYTYSGFERGHHAANDDQAVDPKAREETSLLSNAAPQVAANNKGIWAALELQVRKWAQQYGEVWVITGTLLYDPKEENNATADGWIDYWSIGQNGVAVPTHFYKIVARRKGSSWTALAFVVENKKYTKASEEYPWQNYLVAVSWVEERAGLDFMPDLPASSEEAVEIRPGKVWPVAD